MQRKSSNQSGFTLIEIAIVILVVGLFIGLIAQGLKVYIVSQQQEELFSTIENAEEQFSNYFAAQGRYPCPAPRTGSDMGVSGDCTDTSIAVGDCVDGVCIAQGANGRRVRIGGVPYGDPALSLSQADVIDPFDNQLTYAVTESLATAAYAAGQGDITVQNIDENGNTITNTAKEFIFFSHGRDGAGAFRINGVQHGSECGISANDGGADGVDSENCDNDAVFVNSLVTATANGSAYYDDAVIDVLQLPAINLSCPPGEIILEVVNGVPTCQNFAEMVANSLPEALNDHFEPPSCPAGQLIAGFDGNGQLVCVADQQGSSGGGEGGGSCQCTGYGGTHYCGEVVITGCHTSARCTSSGWEPIAGGHGNCGR